MPGDYHFMDASGIYVTVYWGRVSLVDILETISRRAQEPNLQSAKANVIDLSSATWTEMPPRYVQDEIHRLRPALAPPKIPTVLVTPGEFFFGFARMYALVQVVYGAAKVNAVRSWSEAAQVLGLDLGESEAWARKRSSPDWEPATTTARIPTRG
jgi:hypothetical protein